MRENADWSQVKMVKGGVGRGGGVTEKFYASGDSIPPKTLLKQEGLQLAEASFVIEIR